MEAQLNESEVEEAEYQSLGLCHEETAGSACSAGWS
jgi:hypothetical protein